MRGRPVSPCDCDRAVRRRQSVLGNAVATSQCPLRDERCSARGDLPVGNVAHTLRPTRSGFYAEGLRVKGFPAGELHYAIKGGVGYVGLEPIPGARGGGGKNKA